MQPLTRLDTQFDTSKHPKTLALRRIQATIAAFDAEIVLAHCGDIDGAAALTATLNPEPLESGSPRETWNALISELQGRILIAVIEQCAMQEWIFELFRESVSNPFVEMSAQFTAGSRPG